MPQPPVTSAVANKVSLGNGMWMDDSGGKTTIFSSAGVALFTLTSTGQLSATTFGNTAGTFSTNSNGTPFKVANITLAGQGYPLIVSASVQNKTNLAPTTVSYTPPAFAGTYRITSHLNISTGTTISFKNILGYTDAAGTAQTDLPIWQLEGSATMLVNPTSNTADRFAQLSYIFSIDNSATPITLTDNTGTYTTCVYRYTVVLEQLI